ncbi:MAG: copper amine oxidase N-terminal domain-containing protein, partial [Clostridiales bacterium]|nr:copper amine oxidase N-terminal domain-containing protein [Clostridiales bacterium]
MNKKGAMRRWYAALAVFLFLQCLFGGVSHAAEPVSASSADLAEVLMPSPQAGPSPIALSLRLESPGFDYEGQRYECAAPLILDGELYVPLRAVAEAFGAQITYVAGTDGAGDTAGVNGAGSANDGGADDTKSASPRVEGAFFGAEFAFVPGENAFRLDGERHTLPVPAARSLGDVTYALASALDLCLGTVTSPSAAALSASETDRGAFTICLADDGGILDLSELLGEIREDAIGNSYFRWRMDVPKKSILLS